MSVDPPDFWPTDISLDALSPAMILSQQAEALSRRTRGLVVAELIQDQGDDIVRLAFDLVAPTSRYQHRLLMIRYVRGTVYPAVITVSRLTDIPKNGVKPALDWGVTEDEIERSRVAYSSTEFENLLRVILGSPQSKATIVSLIAKTNETKQPPRLLFQPISTTSATKTSKPTKNTNPTASETTPTEVTTKDGR